MISLLHIFPIESPFCQSLHKSACFDIHTFLRKSSENVIFKCRCNVSLSNLLFQAAVSYAVREKNVIYICPQPPGNVPPGVHGMPTPDANILKTVKFVYMETVDEVTQFLASIHTKTCTADLIILNEAEFYFSQLPHSCLEHKIAKMCALFKDAANYVNLKSMDVKCSVLLSYKDSSNHLLPVFKKFAFTVLDVQEVQQNVFQITSDEDDSKICLTYCTEGKHFLKDLHLSKKKQSNYYHAMYCSQRCNKFSSAN